jgi:hypothetical protein
MNITLKQNHWLGVLVIVVPLFSSHAAVADDLAGKHRLMAGLGLKVPRS